MSYIPDYRTNDNIALLNDHDKAFLEGFQYAMDMARNDIYNAMDDLSRDYDEELVNAFEQFNDISELEVFNDVFENADYISGDDIVDGRKPMHRK